MDVGLYTFRFQKTLRTGDEPSVSGVGVKEEMQKEMEWMDKDFFRCEANYPQRGLNVSQFDQIINCDTRCYCKPYNN